MSISAVGGVSPAQSHVALANISRRESGEAQDDRHFKFYATWENLG